MSKKTYLVILKGGVLLSLLSVFWVFQSWLFPYITSKQIYFNILIEILAVFWIVFILKFPENRPRKSWISYGLLAYFFVILLSSFTGVDFNLSFWGDVERMLGFFHILHFLILYFIIISVFRDWKDWRLLFIASVVIAMFESVTVFTEAKMYGTIGNSAYVAGYLIFNMYFCFLLFFKEKQEKVLRWLYLLPLFLMFPAFLKQDISGAVVGLGFSIICLFFLYGILAKNKKIKITTITVFLALVIIGSLLMIYKDKPALKNNKYLRPITDISFQKNTFQTRLISWKAAIADYKNQPFLGTGYGNYAITFDKYFDASFYTFTRSETYFDRAHNNLVDILATTGILGLVAYLSILIAIAYYLISGYRKGSIDIHEFVLISCLIIAYFVQNLAVFDSLVTYIALFTVLGYVYWLSNKDIEIEESKNSEQLLDQTKEKALLILLIIFSAFIIYQYNYKPMKMLDYTIQSQIAFAQGQIKKAVDLEKQALSYNTGLDRDSRTTFLRSVQKHFNATNFKDLSQEEGQQILDYAIDLAKKNIEYNPEDSIAQMLLAQILHITAIYNHEDSANFAKYSNQALEAVNKSIASSPERVNVYFLKAQILMSRGDKEGTLDTLEYAISLNEKYADSYCIASQAYFNYEQEEEAYKMTDQCIDLGGLQFQSANYIKNIMKHYVEVDFENIESDELERIIKIYEVLSKLDPKNINVWADLAKLYKMAKQTEKAIEAVNKLPELDSNTQAEVDKFIRQLDE